MLVMNAAPLNERLIEVLIAEHQAEIRRCPAPRRDRDRVSLARRLLRSLTPAPRRHRSPCSGDGRARAGKGAGGERAGW